MRIVLGGLIALVVVACGVPAPRAEAQEMGASLSAPFRHDIDVRCDAYDATPAKSWVHFQRLTGRPGVTPRWTLQRSGPPPSAAASEDETLDPGTYAHVVRKNGHVVYARLAALRPNDELGATHTYC